MIHRTVYLAPAWHRSPFRDRYGEARSKFLPLPKIGSSYFWLGNGRKPFGVLRPFQVSVAHRSRPRPTAQ